jgi:hypothetical protein
MTARANGKTGPKTGNGRFEHGADSRRGYGKPGRSGRKPLAFVEQCEALVDDAVLTRVRDYLNDKRHQPDDAAWRWCAEYVTRYTKAEPKRAVEIGTRDDLPIRFKLDLASASLARLHE